MDYCNVIESLGQVSKNEAGIIFGNFLRGGVRQLICEVMAEEVRARDASLWTASERMWSAHEFARKMLREFSRK